jgi:hypothetical protein
MLACHAGDPGSIPGRCISYAVHNLFCNFWGNPSNPPINHPVVLESFPNHSKMFDNIVFFHSKDLVGEKQKNLVPVSCNSLVLR